MRDSEITGRFVAFEPAGPVGQPPAGFSWQTLMQLALEEAYVAADAGEIPVGALVVTLSGKILARAGNRVESEKDATAHAEMIALRQASRKLASPRLSGCILVTTLEPCLMCAGAIMQARISGLVYGASDNLAGAITARTDYFNLPGAARKFWHLGGILSIPCVALLENFFQQLRQK